ncbi:LOW QUALITY PROTEIN: cyclin-SDS, partial [Salvia miltiorrhiza]|uniref:LOW QUALITY PROTEIN: cyclin-SDS n=1 Tax=Salvia miltiorrhiza TaxID=226208 RepID=UPI0025AC33ED
FDRVAVEAKTLPSAMKRKLTAKHVSEIEEQSLCFRRKQLRSQLSRRRRLHISPLVVFSGNESHFATVSEVSCDSSIASVSNLNPPETQDKCQRIVTRSYYRKNFKNASRNQDEAVELSDVSCVESCSGTNRDLNLKSSNVEELEVGVGVTKSEVSSASRFSFPANDATVKENESSAGTTQSEVVFEIPGVNEISCEEITASEAERDNSAKNGRVLLNSAARATKISESGDASEEIRPPNLVAFDFDLACSEQFSSGGVTNGGEEVYDEEEHNSSSSGIFFMVSDSEFSSDYTPSIWSSYSGSQFSERSYGDESSSPTFELFGQFKQQFCRSTSSFKDYDDRNSDEINGLGLEDEEDEESFKMMRMRERRREYVHDYAEEYCNDTAYGDLVIQQRLQMVHWIVEQATKTELQQETMFLGVNLLDRFLCKGYFKSVRNLQIAGIACLTLATRLEENQPYNCVRKKSFYVGSTIYTRCEVVAMEWLVQEILNFKCFLPTVYNFLWFYLKAAKANENVGKTAKYLAVLTLMGHQQLCYWPSTVAAGLVIIASIAADQDASCHLVTKIHARHNDKDLPECIKSMEWLVKYL